MQTALVSKELTVSKYLIDILFNNLFSNAIRHNVNKGDITIELTSTRLVFLNSGNGNALDPQTIFNRFQKGIVPMAQAWV
ncbi:MULTISPECIES: hypothetical protein [unclassified Mucilaginibacter]|uniref:hypothetical protein n=1 Tax=unclassified Mucilaginibacter TaxID=2617802 RepID=UPI002AC9A118|nr:MULTISPECIES: hypothetical protein [unclassified Mucilaginibacter]MEB0261913.1 hypothetical protein [Mucilaginibacter sp. 10I4]MEB0277642.1 hypothetical protein [Mucilaginibacter sp. 10B2]MEB0299557.1 hypothetical protein [Mucilaginibacter sp. 5C4]WPX24730.1 hypothetical protein RHM67_05525 [Mucilaginibacter sp. 5C4]